MRTVSFREARFPWNKASHSLPLKVKSTILIIVIALWTCWWIKSLLKNGLFPKDYVSSWWLQPHWKIMISQNGLFPGSRVENINIWNHLVTWYNLMVVSLDFQGEHGRTTDSPKSSSDSMTFQRKNDHGRVFEGHPKNSCVDSMIAGSWKTMKFTKVVWVRLCISIFLFLLDTYFSQKSLACCFAELGYLNSFQSLETSHFWRMPSLSSVYLLVMPLGSAPLPSYLRQEPTPSEIPSGKLT